MVTDFSLNHINGKLLCRVKGHKSDYVQLKAATMALKDQIGKGHLLSSLGFLATIPFHIPFRHSSPVVVDSVAIGCNRMTSDEQTGRLSV